MPPDEESTAGIVLAGGKSSRMGRNKALMIYRGRPLVEHMAGLLQQAGCAEVHIGGEISGYDCVPDAARHDGPGRAMIDLLRHFQDTHQRLLFVPVDMPLIEVNSLRRLMSQTGSVYYKGYPLPACLMTGDFGFSDSVRDMLVLAGARAIGLPPEWESGMANINTQKEWEEVAS
jgi:molybdopterin-guanine dinucleotide biosynthesis protein A